VFIGAQPATGWLAGQLAEDARGFLITGAGIPDGKLDDASRMPLFLAQPGAMAAGSEQRVHPTGPRAKEQPS
jgi:hypothetical protein